MDFYLTTSASPFHVFRSPGIHECFNFLSASATIFAFKYARGSDSNCRAATSNQRKPPKVKKEKVNYSIEAGHSGCG